MDIAIVGGGISGCVASYNFSKISIPIHLFEMEEQLGGRIQTNLVNGNPIDRGAEYFVDVDEEFMELIADLDISYEKYLSNKAIFDPDRSKYVVLPFDSDSKFRLFRKKLQMLIYLGFRDTLSANKLRNNLDDFIQDITNFFKYKNSDLTRIYDEVKQEFSYLTNNTVEGYLCNELGMSKGSISKLIDPLFRPIYMLDASSINAMMGVLGFALSDMSLYHAVGGNQIIIEELEQRLDHAPTVTISKNTKITTIIKNKDNYLLNYKINEKQIQKSFTHVYFAIPLSALREIEFINFDENEIDKINKLKQIKYNERVYHHLIKGSPVKKINNLFHKQDVESVFISGKSRIWEINLVDREAGIYDLTSTHAFDDSKIEEYFDTFELIDEHHWRCPYPLYTPANMKSIPGNNIVNNHIIAGSDNFVTTLGHSVSMANAVTKFFIKQSSTRSLEKS